MQAGDLVVVEAAEANFVKTLTLSATGGQTWNTEANQTGNGCAMRLFWCVFNGTWSADPSFATTSPTGLSAVMHVFRGDLANWEQDQAFDLDAVTGSPTVVTRAGVTTSVDNCVALAGWGNTGVRTWGSLSGTGWAVAGDAQYRNTGGGDLTVSFAYYVAASAGATGDVTKTANSALLSAHKWIMAWKNVAPPTVTGTLSSTEQADTVTSTGALAIAGSLSASETADTLTASATVAQAPVDGTLNATEAADTLTAEGLQERQATADITEAADTLSAFGSETAGRVGTVAATETADTLTGTGTLAISGSVTATEQADTLTATTALPIAGAVSATEAADTLLAEGQRTRQGTLSATEQADTLDASALLTDFVPGSFGRARAKAKAASASGARATAA
jgi:hypothetical protein